MLVRLFATLCGLFIVDVNAITIDLVRTTGGHLGSHFFLGSTQQYRFLLLDLTETNFWTFASISPVDIPYSSSGPLDISRDPVAVFNVTNATTFYQTTYETYFPFGYYDAPLQAPMVMIQTSSIMVGNTTLRNSSTAIQAITIDNPIEYQTWNEALFDGVFGLGRGLGKTYTNYTMGWMSNTTHFTLYTPRDTATDGKLVINGQVVPAQCFANAAWVNMSRVVYLRYEDYEFNITGVAISRPSVYGQNAANYDYYFIKTWPSTISTMSSFITVDNETWQYLVETLNPVFNPYAINGNDIASPYYRVRCAAASTLKLTIAMSDQFGKEVLFVVPGSSLVKQNPNGDCLLKVKQNAVDAWILGTPFLENYCMSVFPDLNQLAFSNTTDSLTYPTTRTPLDYESQLFNSIFMSRGK